MDGGFAVVSLRRPGDTDNLNSPLTLFFNIYEEFNRLKQTGDYQLVIQEENIEENVQESISKER